MRAPRAESSVVLPRYLVQGYRTGQSSLRTWQTDATAETIMEAAMLAAALHYTHGRTARVIDQEEKVYLRLGTTAEAKRKARQGGAGA